MIIVVDDEDRENEGDLTIAAEKVTPEAINFMATHGRGLICMPMTDERLDELDIPLMVRENTALRNGVLRVDRGEGRDDDRHLRGRSRRDGARRDRSGNAPTTWRVPGTCFPLARARRRARPRRADRGGRRSRAHRRSVSRLASSARS